VPGRPARRSRCRECSSGASERELDDECVDAGEVSVRGSTGDTCAGGHCGQAESFAIAEELLGGVGKHGARPAALPVISGNSLVRAISRENVWFDGGAVIGQLTADAH
jgi:hypothetical protein